MAYDQDQNKPCLKCQSKCSGFMKHSWRMICTQCHCAYYEHDIDYYYTNQSILDELDYNQSILLYQEYMNAQNLAKQYGLNWLPIGVKQTEVDLFLNSLPNEELPRGEVADYIRRQRLRKQIPLQDCNPAVTIEELWNHSKDSNPNLENELREANRFKNFRNSHDLGIGLVEHMNEKDGQPCTNCSNTIHFDEFCIRIKPEHSLTEEISNVSTSNHTPAWHLNCFRCTTCNEYLVDYIYAWFNKQLYCLRHYGQSIRPRCVTCDHVSTSLCKIVYIYKIKIN
uniref:LIMPETin; Putative four and A half lim domains n=1 Tax=Schistosoma mansoni TaxID=6183 RepID=A0A5K4EDY1_SCHMA